MSTQNQSVEKYFNLFAHGHAYVRRIREVKPKRSTPFLACDLFALDRGQTRRIDVKIVGREAEETIRPLMTDVNEKGARIAVEFRAGDLYVDPYEDPKQPGQFKVSIKGRLLLVPWIGEGEIRDPADLEFAGLGYLNRVYAHVDTLKASLSALHGAADAVEYTPFDCVVDRRIDALVRSFQAALDEEKRVLIGFKSRGLVPRVFKFEKGDKQGQHGGSIGSTLREITWAKVNGDAVAMAKSGDESQPPSDPPPANTENALAALI